MLVDDTGFIIHTRIYATNNSVISRMLIVMHFGVCCMFHKIYVRDQTYIQMYSIHNTTNIIYTVDGI